MHAGEAAVSLLGIPTNQGCVNSFHAHKQVNSSSGGNERRRKALPLQRHCGGKHATW